jgi:hypothetical protein
LNPRCSRSSSSLMCNFWAGLESNFFMIWDWPPLSSDSEMDSDFSSELSFLLLTQILLSIFWWSSDATFWYILDHSLLI